MTNTQYLEELIKNSGYKKEFLAHECGITRQAFANKIANKSLFTAKEVSILCNLLKITTMSEIKAIFFAKEVE